MIESTLTDCCNIDVSLSIFIAICTMCCFRSVFFRCKTVDLMWLNDAERLKCFLITNHNPCQFRESLNSEDQNYIIYSFIYVLTCGEFWCLQEMGVIIQVVGVSYNYKGPTWTWQNSQKSNKHSITATQLKQLQRCTWQIRALWQFFF